MLLSEEEARKKVCPHLPVDRVQGSIDPDRNCVWQFARCIASACMAWRWAEEKNEEAQMAFEACCPTGASMGCEVTGPSPVGYCGLAGRPE